MENFTIKPPSIHLFAKIIFVLLSAVTVVVLFMLFFMQINDSVRANNGEILATNAPISYTAYMDGEVKQLYVREGESIYAGDTLLILQNEALYSEYQMTIESHRVEQSNLQLNQKELEILHEKTRAFGNQKQLNHQNRLHIDDVTNIEVKTLVDKIQSLEQKLSLSSERLNKDKELVEEGILSQELFEEKSRIYIDELNLLNDFKKEFQLKKSAKTSNHNSYLEKNQTLKINEIDLEKEIIGLEKLIAQQKVNIQNLDTQKKLLFKQLQKLIIIAEDSGIVTTVFDENSRTRFIPKGTSLLTVRPIEQQQFFARLQISQQSVAKVQPGQSIHLKLDAYNHYQYGILKGTITSVSPKDTSNQFYLLAEIPEVPPTFALQSGYKIKGDIILRRMKLYRFMIERLFQKLE